MKPKSVHEVFGRFGRSRGDRALDAARSWLLLSFRTLVIKRRDSEEVSKLVEKIDSKAPLSESELMECAGYLRTLAKEFYYEEIDERISEEALMAMHYIAMLKVSGPGRSKKARHAVAVRWDTNDESVKRARTNNAMLESMMTAEKNRYVGKVRRIRRNPAGGPEVVEKWTELEFYKNIVAAIEYEISERRREPPRTLTDAESDNLVSIFDALAKNESACQNDGTDWESVAQSFRAEIHRSRMGLCPRCWSVNDEWSLVTRQWSDRSQELRCPNSGCGFSMTRIA